MAKDTEVFPKPNTKFEAVMFESPNLNILLYILDQKPKYKPGHLEKVRGDDQPLFPLRPFV
jgi:hypothetical protein